MKQVSGFVVMLLITFVLSIGPAWAADGFYLGMDLGIAVAPDLDLDTGGLDDWSSSDASSTRCDQTINPDGLQTEPGVCARDPSPWGPLPESFDGGQGILAGATVGYRFGAFRAEGEYFYRNANLGSTTNPYPEGLGGGYNLIEDSVESVFAHNFFANLYYDYRSDSKWTPYVGAGIGVARTSINYRTLWQRATNPSQINVFTEGQSGAELNQSLAGVLSYDQATMTDTLLGGQVLAGLDYQMSERVSVGVKARYALFGTFEDESAYTRLRGHASVAGNPPVPVTYYIKSDNLEFWGVSLNMKYAFN